MQNILFTYLFKFLDYPNVIKICLDIEPRWSHHRISQLKIHYYSETIKNIQTTPVLTAKIEAINSVTKIRLNTIKA